MKKGLLIKNKPFFILQQITLQNNPKLLTIITHAIYLFLYILIKHKFRLRTKDVRYLTKKRQYSTKGIFGFRRIKQYPNKKFNQISCHIGAKLNKRATTRNQIRRTIINYIRDNHIESTPINGIFYKIFINLDKNQLPELIKYIQEHKRSEWNTYFKKEFESAFISFNSYLCEKN